MNKIINFLEVITVIVLIIFMIYVFIHMILNSALLIEILGYSIALIWAFCLLKKGWYDVKFKKE